MNIEFLKWDTDNFNFKVGKVVCPLIDKFQLTQVRSKMEEKGFMLVYLICNSQIKDISLFYDKKIVYHKNRKLKSNLINNNIISYKNHPVTEELKALSLASGIYSRYYLDVDFPRDKFELLYTKWIENSLLTDYASDVLLYLDNNTLKGILTYRIINHKAIVGIIAIDNSFRGCGIGSCLINYFESNLPSYVTVIEVATQGCNITACNFYEKNSYTIANIKYIYHVWNKSNKE